jgi:spermidine/putrescine transport system ATP-binding protein
LIELTSVCKRFGAFTAVDDVSLRIGAGEFLTLLGPSGCGKTTLLRMISGFESPDRGRVRLAGVDVTDQPPYQREVNQVFQNYALFPHLTVQQNIAYGLRMRWMKRQLITEKVTRGIELVSLNGLENRLPSQLSGGQRQRVALARALVCEPKVLLLDEPLAALDAKLRRAMQLELKHLQSRVGITFVFVTHDQEEAITMSDRIAVMNGGKIEQLGTPSEVYHRPRTKFVATFLGHTNLLKATVVCPGRVRLVDGSELGCDGAAIPDSGEILLSIRPERIQLEPSSSENVIEATLTERIFKGSFEQFTLRSTRGLELLWVGPTQMKYTLGQLLRCRLASEDLVRVLDR